MDAARAMYLDLTGHGVSSAPVREGRKWMVEDCDIGSSLRYWRDERLTFVAWLKSLGGIKETAYFAPDDLLPFWDMCLRSLKVKLPLKFATNQHSLPRQNVVIRHASVETRKPASNNLLEHVGP
jgi:predicted ATP-grasp superfamily ATP-dependent carboligase